MDGAVALGLLVLAFGGVVAGMGVLQWRGRLPRGRDPEALTERLYLLVPTGLGAVLVGVAFLVMGWWPDEEGAVWALVVSLFVLAGLGGTLGILLWLVQPERLRPAWQRRQAEGIAARQAPPRGSGPFSLDVVKLREPVRDPRRFVTEDEAVAAAEALLAEDPDVEHVLVVDGRVRAGVRYVER
jgi:hypothetical protein